MLKSATGAAHANTHDVQSRCCYRTPLAVVGVAVTGKASAEATRVVPITIFSGKRTNRIRTGYTYSLDTRYVQRLRRAHAVRGQESRGTGTSLQLLWLRLLSAAILRPVAPFSGVRQRTTALRSLHTARCTAAFKRFRATLAPCGKAFYGPGMGEGEGKRNLGTSMRLRISRMNVLRHDGKSIRKACGAVKTVRKDDLRLFFRSVFAK